MLSEDEKYMRRCLQLAANGIQGARPNPMVGAVISLPPAPSIACHTPTFRWEKGRGRTMTAPTIGLGRAP